MSLVVAHVRLDFADGGAQRLSLVGWRHLDRRRFRPVLICLRGGGTLLGAARAQGVEVHELGRLRRPFDVAAVPLLARRLRALGARVLHVPLYSRASPYARAAARLAGVPLVVAHEYGRGAPPRALRRWADAALAPGTRFLAASAAQRRELLDAGRAASRIEVLHDGIEVERFAAGDALRVRRELGVGEAAPLVLVPARLHPMKGHADLLAGIPALRARVPGVVVACAGTGPLATHLPALARSGGVDDVVRFLGHREDMPDLLAAADLVALPSHSEGLPAAMLEAFAAARAVVATAVGGVPEALRDGVEGRLVPARQPEALAAAIAEVLRDAPARAAMGAAGRRTVLASFQAEPAARRLEALYERWLRETADATEVDAA